MASVRRRPEKGGQHGQDLVNLRDARVDSAQGMIQSWEFAGFDRLQTQLVEAVLVGEEEDGVQRERAAQRKNVFHAHCAQFVQ